MRWTATHSYLVTPLAMLAIVVGVYAYLYIPAKEMPFSYGQKNICQSSLVILPSQHATTAKDGISLQPYGVHQWLGIDWWAQGACLQFTSTPPAGHYRLQNRFKHFPLLSSSYVVTIPAAPQVDISQLPDLISASSSLTLPLSSPDVLNSYHLVANQQNATCQTSKQQVECSLADLRLEQGHQYDIQLNRTFTAATAPVEPEKLYSGIISTVKPTNIVKASLKDQQVVYNFLQQIKLEFDKPIAQAEAQLYLQSDSSQEVPLQINMQDTKVTISWQPQLERGQAYLFKLTKLLTEDGATTSQPFQLTFRTSEGPKLTGITLARQEVQADSVAALNFDQELSSSINLKQIIKVSHGYPQMTVSGKEILLKLKGLPNCTDFTIEVDGKVANKHGVSSAVKWNYNARSACPASTPTPTPTATPTSTPAITPTPTDTP